jgi:predicted ABC-type ATPase
MEAKSPSVVILAGPNGAGKSTTAPALLKGVLGVTEFVNADVIARGLSGFRPEGAAMTAGRVMLARLHELARQRVSFAFETTLASRLFAPWVEDLIAEGYQFHLVFLWLPSPDLAVARVAARVRLGGHDVPEETIRRRFDSGLRNFFHLYQPLAKTWRLYDNSVTDAPRLVARGTGTMATRVADRQTWERIVRGYADEH